MTLPEDLLRFGGLTAPLAVPDFLHAGWPGQFHVSHASHPALSTLLEQPELRDIESFCNTPNGGGLHVNHTREERLRIESNTDPAYAIEQFRAGNTIQILDIKTDETKRWNRSLDAVLGLIPGTALINGFTSLPGKGLPWHWDSQEVFIVQVRGRKLWHVAANDYVESPTVNGMATEQPTRELAFQLKDPTRPIREPAQWQVVEMDPGSVMFMPRGYWHKVEENIDESLHLVLQVRMPCWRDMFRFMLDNAPDLFDLEWRRPTAALNPENLMTLGSHEFKERLASLDRLASAEMLMAMAKQFSNIIEGGSLYSEIAKV